MNINDVRRLTKEFAQEYWGLDFNIPVEENGRLTNALGRVRFTSNRTTGKWTPKKLEIAKRMFANYSDETIISVIKHELCHWALCVQNKPFDDGHPVFEAELKRVGGSSTFTIQQAGNLYTVICTKCGKTRQKNNSQGKLRKYVHGTPRRTFSSGCCHAPMAWGPMIYVEDRNGEVDNNQSRTAQAIQRRALMATASSQVAAAIAPTPVTPPQPRKPAQVFKPVNGKLEEILVPGPRGVTNKQMIPAIIAALEMHNKDLVNELSNQYPDVFEGSVKYLNKTYKSLYTAVMG